MRKRSLTERWYRAPIASGLAKDSQVDHEAGTITGLVVMEEGLAVGHGEEVDEQTLLTLVELEGLLDRGAKSRFGHPELSADAITKFAGRQNNFRMHRKDGKSRVLGDLVFDPSAMADPSKMAERIMLRAETDHTSFGNSVVIKRDLEFRFEEDGKTRTKDEDGEDLPPLIRPLALLASDLVDSPAATTALFSEHDFFGTDAQLSAAATEALDHLLEGPDADDRLAEYFRKFARSRPGAAVRIGAIVAGYTNRQETSMESETEKPEDEAKTLLGRLGALFSLRGESGGPPKGRPEPPPRPLLPIDVEATMPALEQPGDTELAQLRAEMTEMKATIEEDRTRRLADRVVADEATKAAFEARVEAQVALGKLTASGAAAIKARGMSLLLAGADPSEAIKAFEVGPSPDDVAGLRQPLTFVVPIPGKDDLPVDLSGYGVRKAPDGSFVPADPEAAKALAVKVGDKTGAELVEALKDEYMEGVA